LERIWKSFHFQEKNWLISFPSKGNEGRKYLHYTVKFINRNSKENKEVFLAEIVENPQFEESLPYTVGFFRGSIDEKTGLEIAYLEIRIIRSIEEFWKFLNDLNI
jgi:hypothetical protein